MNLRATLLASVMLLPLGAAGACRDMHNVNIQLINDAEVPPHLLANAVREATWLLTSLCVHITWSIEKSEGLEIHILSAPLINTNTSCLGIALPAFGKGNRGAVFLSRIQEAVASHPDLTDTKTLLAHVLAHEIGHLLLHTSTHVSTGIMQADFGASQLRLAYQRRLIFTESDRQTFVRIQNPERQRRECSQTPALCKPGCGASPLRASE
jgi:hypothetical protein